MFTNTKVTHAVRLALVFGAASTAVLSATAAAQTAESAEKKVERIEVTGSRIKRADVETASPVSVFDIGDIKDTGSVTIAEFLRTTASSSGGFNESQGLSQAGGASSVGIKGFSPEYTLILLNGRRIGKNSAGGIFTDINQLPMAAVERIEVLSDGASAIYGSDAVAGVINVITKKDFEGIQIEGRGGFGVEEHDGQEGTVSVVAGTSSDKTNIMIAVDHFEKNATPMSHRNLGSSAVLKDANGNVIPGGEGRSPSGTPGYTTLSRVTGAGSTIAASALGNDVMDSCPADRVNSSNQCLFDVGPLYFSNPETNRQSIFTQVTHQYNDDLKLNAQFRYNRVYVLNSNGAAPGGLTLAGGTAKVQPSQYVVDYLFNDRYKGNAALAQQALDELKTGKASLTVVRRFLDFGNRNKDVTNQTYEAVSGFEYNINDDYTLTGDLGFSRLTNQQAGTTGNLITSSATEAFVSGKLNPFVVNDCSSAALKAICNPLNAKIHRTSEYTVGFGSLVLSGLLPFELSGGQVGIATGIDARNEYYNDVSDPATVRGEVLGGAGSNGGGSYHNEAAFVELSLPVLESVEITAAGRHDKADWSLADDSQTTYSTKITYRPTDELMLRASTGSGFKAPNLSNLFLATSSGVLRAIDTKLCNAAVAAGGDPTKHADCQVKELNSRSGGNPELTSERSKTTTVGIVYEPIDNLSFSLDFWRLKIDNIIGSLGIQEILNEEAAGRLTELVVRSPEGVVNDSLRQGYVRTNLQNLNEREAEGLILDATDKSDIGFGTLTSNLRAEYRLKDMNQSSKSQPLCDSTKTGGNLTGNARFTLEVAEYEATLSARYIDGDDIYNSRDTANKSCNLLGYLLADGTRTPLKRASYTEFTLSGTYNVSADTSVNVGIRNLFDRDPPFSAWNAWPFYDQQLFANQGRFAYFGFSTKF